MNDDDFQERKIFLRRVEEYFGQNDFGAALDLAQSRLNCMPGDLDARIAICRVWIQQGRLDEAREMLGEMEAILTSLSQVYACIGDICLKKGMPDSAELFYRKFTLLNPGAPLPEGMTARLQEIEERGEASAAGLDEESEENAGEVPSDFQTVTLAELYIRQGHLAMAQEVLETIVAKDPGQEKAAERLAEVREMARREETARRYAPVIAELSRWLDNIGRLRNHAA